MEKPLLTREMIQTTSVLGYKSFSNTWSRVFSVEMKKLSTVSVEKNMNNLLIGGLIVNYIAI
jgi:hypothetical protein